MMHHTAPQTRRHALRIPHGPLPGILLCLAVTAVAAAAEQAELRLFHKAWLETLNLALIAGLLLRTVWKPDQTMQPGITCCSKTLLNTGIVLLGAASSPDLIRNAGPALLLGVPVIVALSLTITCLIGKLAGLPPRKTLLVACGNSICGNSAIMAAAPVIHAEEDDIGATIAFTAAGGLLIVIALPLAAPLLPLSNTGRGILAGLTVYAVPQVIAASAPFGMAAAHMGTLVKLMRVLMLGPVCIALALIAPRLQTGTKHPPARPALSRLVPWYITGFLLMMLCRAFSLIPDALVTPLSNTATFLTILAMAALGLSVDLRSVTRGARPLLITVTLSLVSLITTSVLLVTLLHP